MTQRRTGKPSEGPWIEIGFLVLLVGLGIWLSVTLDRQPGVIVPPAEEPSATTATPEPGSLTESQEQAIGVVQEMEKLLLSLAGLLIAGVTAIVAKDGILRPAPPRPARLLLGATMVAAAFSIYFGYFTQVRLLEILEQGHFSARAEQFWAPLRWQVRLFLSALAGLGGYVLLTWFHRGSKPKED